MTGRIAVINSKGGCGKTTIATHLAAAFAVSRLRTGIADLDRQKNALLWSKLRDGDAAKVELLDWNKDFGKQPKKLDRLIIDCPASLRAKNVREVVAESDIVVVPLLPSIYDEMSTKRFMKRLREIKAVRKGKKDILMAANRYRPAAVASQRMEQFVEKNGYQLAARIPDRALYPALAEQGLTVFDVNQQAPREQQKEWMPLIWEIERICAD